MISKGETSLNSETGPESGSKPHRKDTLDLGRKGKTFGGKSRNAQNGPSAEEWKAIKF